MTAKVIRGPWLARPADDYVPRSLSEMQELVGALVMLQAAVRHAEQMTLRAITIHFPDQPKPHRRGRKPKHDEPPAA